MRNASGLSHRNADVCPIQQPWVTGQAVQNVCEELLTFNVWLLSLTRPFWGYVPSRIHGTRDKGWQPDCPLSPSQRPTRGVGASGALSGLAGHLYQET